MAKSFLKFKMLVMFFWLLSSSVALGADYVIGEGDGLKVSVWGVAELNFTAKVRPDGKITAPALGEVVASGLTPKALQDVIADKLKLFLKDADPNVSVSVEDITNVKVYIFGGGVKSGVYDLTRRTTLLQLLCQLGDVSAADLRSSYILRNGAKIKENFYKLFRDGDTSDDLQIEINDVIYIPMLNEKNVYVVGAVNSPKFIPYRDGITVMEAILESGGFTKFAKPNNTNILRKEGGKETAMPVRLKDLVENGDLSQNIKLKAGDYVVVKEGIF